MAWGLRSTRRKMEDRIGGLKLPVRHSGQCGDCGNTVDMYRDVKADSIMPSHIKVATCPACGDKWIISKI